VVSLIDILYNKFLDHTAINIYGREHRYNIFAEE